LKLIITILLCIILIIAEANEKAAWKEDIIMLSYCSFATSGGRSNAASTICIPNMKCLIGAAALTLRNFAWLPGHVKLLFEIKGYATHVRDMDRHKYCSELNREMFLFAMGYHVLSFAYDDVEQRPELCISMLRMCLSRFQTRSSSASRVMLSEKELVLLALQNARSIRPKDVEIHFEIDHKTAILMLQRLTEKGWLQPTYVAKQERIVRYSLTKDAVSDLL
jgi:hypothetical protein